MTGCESCPLHKTRSQVVVGRGELVGIRYMFVGEAPGADEDESGLPFVGASGKKLTAFMERAGIDPSAVYISNVVKCRPPDNRTPFHTEVKACSVHLHLQMRVIKPPVIVTVGNTPLQFFLPQKRIMQVHGQVLSARTGQRIFPIIHPAAALRNPEYNALILKDLKKLAALEDQESSLIISPRIV